MWGEDDYILEVFPRWSRDRRGGLWLASLDDRVVGFGKLTLLGDREAWIHGLRVAPEARQRGVGTALLQHRLTRARKLGARVARLDTGNENVAMLRLARRAGMRPVEALTFWRARARAGALPGQAHPAQQPAIWRLARGAMARGPLFGPEPRERRLLDRDSLRRAIRSGLCLVVGDPPAAFALVSGGPPNLRPRNRASGIARRRAAVAQRLLAQTIAGQPAAMRELLRRLPAEAARRGLRGVGVNAPLSLATVLRATGYQRWTGHMVVFEARLRARA